jgi:16S rRNA (guanine(527)-N(7))-methyltransferase RsmG
MNNDTSLLRDMIGRLNNVGFKLDSDALLQDALSYMALIQEWNKYASLVSLRDAESALAGHIVDSWTLLPWIRENITVSDYEYIDLGAGGGFPAIPLCIVLQDLNAELVERNTKKTTFLRKVIARLGLKHVTIENLSFEGEFPDGGPRLITSRAIEKPKEVIPEIIRAMGAGDVYLCQSEAMRSIQEVHGVKFHVEHLDDEYSKSGLRRSELFVVRRSDC